MRTLLSRHETAAQNCKQIRNLGTTVASRHSVQEEIKSGFSSATIRSRTFCLPVSSQMRDHNFACASARV
jgi:predicted naringenin-chalcone synthase